MLSLPTLFLLIAAPCFGSFLANLAVRLPQGRSVLVGRSACPHCQAALTPIDLVPILSWVWLGGRCRVCGGRISVYYPAVELAALGIAVWALFAADGDALLTIISFALGCWLLPLAIIDARSFWLPDSLTLTLIPAGLLACWLLDPDSLPAHIIGAAAGFVLFFAVSWAYRRFRGREGLGGGDAKLLAGLGAWDGWTGLPDIILLAALGGLLFAAAQALVARRLPDAAQRLAFGPFLCLAGWLVWLYAGLNSLAGWS
jgi:leader peptidase (prepilin peptidase)/N-methyltransferase